MAIATIPIKSEIQKQNYIARMTAAKVEFRIKMGEEPIMNGDSIEYEDAFELEEADARRVFPELYEPMRWTSFHTALLILTLLLIGSILLYVVSWFW